MKKTLKQRLMRLDALVLVLAVVLTGCGSSSTSRQNKQKDEDLEIVSAGASEFRIIYGVGCSEDTVEAAGYLQREITRLTGVTLDVCEDMSCTPSEENWEILVGATDRSEDDLTYSTMERTGDYQICVQGRKLTIAATLTECMTAAIQALCDVLGDYADADALTLPADFALSGSAAVGLAAELPAFGYGSFLAATVGGSGTELLVYRADSDDCDDYLERLEAEGYEYHTVREIDHNRYFTYVGNGATLTVMDNPNMGTVRVSVEPVECRLATEPEKVDAVVQPSVTMLGLEGYATSSGTPNQTGLSMLYQLSDGSFIVVDGGHNNEVASRQLYETMAALAPEPDNITIAAWLITHTHNDHAGAFLSFRRNYALDVKLEKLLINFPSDKQYEAAATSTYYRDNILADIAYYPGVEVIRVHPGQVFYLRDAVMEILYTLELYEPAGLADFNNSSIVCVIELGGQKVMQTGDCGILTSGILMDNYAEALKCDILQMSHHGAQGGTEDLYRAVDPRYVLWPSGSSTFNACKNASNNVWLLNESNMQQLWVARDDIVTLPLPISE